MRKLYNLIGLVFLLIVSISLASAHMTHYNLDSGDHYVSKYSYQKDYIFLEDYYGDYSKSNKRYGLYDYRHGYTYRATEDFRKKSHTRPLRYVRATATKDHYYEYNRYTRDYEVLECYHYPPADKLFYRKCPSF